jgi:hypothetical protein
MTFRQKLMREIKTVALTTLYFAAWFLVLMLLKRIVLSEYQIEFRGLGLALFGALVVAKVVLLMEHVSLGEWLHRHAAAVDVIIRTLWYTLGVFIVLLLEKAFESRHEFDGFWSALVHVFEHRDMPHVWANTICVGWALLAFNSLSILRKHLGEGQLSKLFFSPRKEVSAREDS